MNLIQQIKDEIKRSDSKEVFKTFDELYIQFPDGKPDHFRPIKPVDLKRMHEEAGASGLEDFQKDLGEGGVWFKLR